MVPAAELPDASVAEPEYDTGGDSEIVPGVSVLYRLRGKLYRRLLCDMLCRLYRLSNRRVLWGKLRRWHGIRRLFNRRSLIRYFMRR